MRRHCDNQRCNPAPSDANHKRRKRGDANHKRRKRGDANHKRRKCGDANHKRRKRSDPSPCSAVPRYARVMQIGPPSPPMPPWTLGLAGRARPLIWGHRGADHHLPSSSVVENTLPAFAQACTAGADGIELDVRLCASGEVVVFHDHDLARLAGRAVRVDQLTLAQLQSTPLTGGARVPTLAQVFAAVPPDMLVNVEIKSPRRWSLATRQWSPSLRLLRADRLVRAVLDIIARYRAEARVLVSSFDPLVLAAVRVRAPHVPVGYLFEAGPAPPLGHAWRSRALRAHAVHPPAGHIDRAQMRVWRRRNLAINAWTVDDPAEIVRLSALGVDGIITNAPAAALAALAG